MLWSCSEKVGCSPNSNYTVTFTFSVKVGGTLAGGEKKKGQLNWKVNSSGKLYQLHEGIEGFRGYTCRVDKSWLLRACWKGAITVEQFASKRNQHFFQFFHLNRQNKEHNGQRTWTKNMTDAQLLLPEVVLCDNSLSFKQGKSELIA